MPALPYGVGAFKRTAGRLPEVRVVNLYVEQVPEGGSPVVLIPRPALVASYSLAPGPVGALWQQPGTFGGDILAQSGATIYRASTALGNVNGGGRAVFAGDDAQVLVTAGGSLYRSTGSGLAAVSFPDSADVADIAYLNGYFLAAREGTAKVYFSAVGDGSSWDGLDFFTAERKPDNLVSIIVVGDEVWLIGQNSTEVWVPTGDADLPFQRVEGRLYDRGCRARDTVCRFDNSVAWVGDDGIVYRADAQPLRISNHGIEERIAQTDAGDLRAFAFTFQGHTFYCLTTAQGTYAYDAATQQWCQFASYGRASFRGHVGCMVEGVTYLGDDTSGQIYTLSDNTAADGDDPIQRLFSVNVPLTGQPVRCDVVSVDVSVGQTDVLVGQGSAPVIEMRFSRDAGNTWTEWRAVSLGPQGFYRTRAAWLRNGIIDEPGRVMEFRTSDPVPLRLSSVTMNERGGGLSR